MGKKIKFKKKVITNAKPMTENQKDRQTFRDVILNESMSRTALFKKLIDPRRDINAECGYPNNLTIEDYKLMYDREGIATRVVSLFPQESWSEDPLVIEDEEAEPTEFETAWTELERERQLFSYMMRIDELSGIGRFGILLLGFDDGGDLNEPVDGINEQGLKVGNPQHKLLYLRPFDESSVKVKSTEGDRGNPRYGRPTMYVIAFKDDKTKDKNRNTIGEGAYVSSGVEQSVHWTRVIHIADNLKSSEVYGVPRMQTLFNRLYDLRKIVSGSGEMFWKGAFPGYAFELDPNSKPPVPGSDEDKAMKEQIASWQDGLQRVIQVQGVTVNSLEPQISDPSNHFEVQVAYISIAMGVPKRIFMGAERGELASSQDQKAHNKRVARRQKKYLTPYIVRAVIDRLINLGVLPEPKQYDVKWPDLDTPSNKDKAEVLKAQMEAYAKYVQGDVDMLIPPEALFKMFVGMDEDQIKEIMKLAGERQDEVDEAFEKEQAELDKAAKKEEADLRKLEAAALKQKQNKKKKGKKE